MNLEYMEVNRSVYMALSSLGPISTSMVSMFAVEDPCIRHPFLRFRFTDVPKSAPIYAAIGKALAEFHGQLKWGLFTKAGTENYIIAPILIDHSIDGSNLPSLEQLLERLGQEGFEKMIDAAMQDLPALAESICNCKSGN